jgi:hypothetical protein
MKTSDEIWAEQRDPFHRREIAEIITAVAREESNLVNFVIFPSAFGSALAAFKMIVGATHALKKPFFTTWQKHMVLSTLKEPAIFELLASDIVLSAAGKRDGMFWNGKGRLIDVKVEENMRQLGNLYKEFGLEVAPESYFIEIVISPYFDRVKHLLERAN